MFSLHEFLYSYFLDIHLHTLFPFSWCWSYSLFPFLIDNLFPILLLTVLYLLFPRFSELLVAVFPPKLHFISHTLYYLTSLIPCIVCTVCSLYCICQYSHKRCVPYSYCCTHISVCSLWYSIFPHEVYSLWFPIFPHTVYSLWLLCRWFRFAQLAKGKKSRP